VANDTVRGDANSGRRDVTDQPDPYAPPTPGSAPPEPAPYAAQPPSWETQPAGDYASWGRRVGGRLIDAICVIVPAAIIGAAAGSGGLYQLVAFIGTLVIGYLNGATGQSPGKRAVGVRLIRESDGGHLGGGMGILREIVHIVDSLALLLGWLWPLWDKKRQTFADKILSTVVVRD
jgi:uncharacterized RDD family membrane protein YckC